jgi:16S rRNA (guanine527-N7)-methyltransferase
MSYLNQLGSSAAELCAGIQSLGLSSSEAQLEQLSQYALLLQKWGSVYNLTANKEISQIVSLHLLDSLAIVSPLLREVSGVQDLLDVGSGAGLPGVILAIMCPQVQVHCVDAVAKKAAFIQQAAISLGLRNLISHHARIEDLHLKFDVITSRAFSSLLDFVNFTTKNLKPEGRWLAMKGLVTAEELAPVATDEDVFHVEPLKVPGLDANRNIVWMKKRE